MSSPDKQYLTEDKVFKFFDPTIIDPSLLKEGKLAVTLKDSWHLQLYNSAQKAKAI